MEKTSYSITLEKLIKDIKLEIMHLPKDAKEILITTNELNRPGLQLGGFYGGFDEDRLQLFGLSEFAFMESLPPKRLKATIEEFFTHSMPAVLITNNKEVPECMFQAAKEKGVALLRTKLSTSELISSLISILNVELAPRITRHGVLVEVYGEGILLMGESGVGKSETAIELIKRGHRIIADDAVEIRRVSDRTLVGTSPDNIRHFMELRGVGIINARRIFGMGAVKVSEKLDIVVQLETWNQSKVYDRMGIESEYINILGLDIPSVTIPVKPGRNLAVIIEVAAMNNRQKKLGYNAAQELLENLGMISQSGNTLAE